jgi:ATP-dependent Clp protease ATP-binding subunit ClpB
MTSNLGSQYLLEGINDKGEISETARSQVMNELHKWFRPEFLNRVDETVLFKPLTLQEIERIVELMVDDLRNRLQERQIKLELTENARLYIAAEGYDPVFGARPLKRFLQSKLRLWSAVLL